MNSARKPFRINIGFLINQPTGTLREIPFEMGEFIWQDDFRVNDLRGTITLAKTQNGIRSLLDFSAVTDAECGRCLEPFKQKLATQFEEIFTFENRPLSEDEQIIPENGNLDFESLIGENLILALPYTPVCKEDCKGLCIVCGQNLNEEACEHVSHIKTRNKLTSSNRTPLN